MKRIALIDHDNHTLYVEDIDEDFLDKRYEGNILDYIEDNYSCEDFYWDYINDAQYIPATPIDYPIQINFDDIKDI